VKYYQRGIVRGTRKNILENGRDGLLAELARIRIFPDKKAGLDPKSTARSDRKSSF
jgi:hypothetical protein